VERDDRLDDVGGVAGSVDEATSERPFRVRLDPSH
jgi:hypothetical protein